MRECTQTYMTEADDEGDAVLAEKETSGTGEVIFVSGKASDGR